MIGTLRFGFVPQTIVSSNDTKEGAPPTMELSLVRQNCWEVPLAGVSRGVSSPRHTSPSTRMSKTRADFIPTHRTRPRYTVPARSARRGARLRLGGHDTLRSCDLTHIDRMDVAQKRRLPDCEAQFVEHAAIHAPQLDSPLVNGLSADGGTAVRAVTGAGIGLDAKLHGPAQAIALIPAVLNRRGGCGYDLRVEEHRPGWNLTGRSFASPRPEVGAELYPDHRWRRGRFCERVWRSGDRVVLASCGLRLRGRLPSSSRSGRRRRWIRGRSLWCWRYGGRRRRLGLLGPTAPGPRHHEKHDQQPPTA
jgi:hypothetical protein